MPLSLMQKHAVRMFRWTERMNRPEPDIGEFADKREEYLVGDQVPQTLIDALKHFATDLVPETEAACKTINDWLVNNKEVSSGTEVERGLGMCRFLVDGCEMEALAQPFRFYVLKLVQDAYEGMNETDRGQVDELLDACDMRDLLGLKLDRGIGRANNLEVWL